MFLSRVTNTLLASILRPVVILLRPVAVLHHFLLNLTSVAHYLLRFRVRPDDIFVVTYPRSGTTWTQMILYQIVSDGDVDFAHISEKCPWLERLWVHNRVDPESLPSPRVFKTHLKYSHVPKHPQARYIYVARDGLDVAVSYYHHYRTILRYAHDFDTFFDAFIKGGVQAGEWADHVHDWWLNPKDLNVLFLTYEEMKNDLSAAVDRIAEFCGIELDPQHRQRVLQRSSFSYMKEHEDKFEHLNELLWEWNLDGKTKKFIREGKSGHGADRMSDEQIRRYREATRKIQKAGVTFPPQTTGETR
jgi:LPS sulfotransferase NodH